MKHFIIAVLVSLICSEAAAQDWVSTGGPGGGFYQIRYKDKNDIFLSAGTLLRSTDAGQSWEKIAPPDAPDGSNWSIAIAANQDIYITGGSDSNRIWKSKDNGDTWNRIWLSDVYYLFTSPDSTIYVSTRDYSFLLRSKNSDTEWDSIPTPLNFFPFGGIVDSNGVMIFSSTDGVIRSTDRGMSWSNVLSVKGANYYDNLIACGKNGNIFIMMSNYTHYFAYHSTDDGLHWTLIPDIEDYGTFSVSPSGKVFFMSSVYHAYSDDNGTTWTKCANTYPLIYGYINPDADSGFYVSDGYATFFSNELCGNWAYTSMPTGIVEDLISYKDTKIFASVGSATNQLDFPIGIWESDIASSKWNFDRTPQPRTGGASQCRGKFGLDSSQNIFYIAGILYRYNTGGTWDSIAYTYTLDVSRVNSPVIYPDGIWFAASGDGVCISTDNGVTWHQPNNQLLHIDGYHGYLTRSKTGILYAGEFQSIFRSDDTGKTCVEFLIPGISGEIEGLITDAFGNVFVASSYPATMYRSTDQGQTWAEFGNGLACTFVHSMIELSDGSIAAATDSGVFILPLAGCEWQPYSLGLWTKDILSLACSKTGEFYAGTNGCGVFKSTKLFNDTLTIAVIDQHAIDYRTVAIGSTSCQDVVLRNKGNKPFTITSFTVVDPFPFSVSDESAKKIPVTLNPNDFVTMTICFHPYQPGIYGSSIVWNTDIDSALCGMSRETALHGVAIIQSSVPIEQSKPFFSISPNPIHDKADLNFSLEGESHVKIECFDLLGRSVKIITDGNFQAGKHVLTCDFSNLSEGVYIIQCSFGHNRESRSIIIM